MVMFDGFFFLCLFNYAKIKMPFLIALGGFTSTTVSNIRVSKMIYQFEIYLNRCDLFALCWKSNSNYVLFLVAPVTSSMIYFLFFSFRRKKNGLSMENSRQNNRKEIVRCVFFYNSIFHIEWAHNWLTPININEYFCPFIFIKID